MRRVLVRRVGTPPPPATVSSLAERRKATTVVAGISLGHLVEGLKVVAQESSPVAATQPFYGGQA